MPSLLEHVRESLAASALGSKDNLLLACSGGKDSMVLFHVLRQLQMNFSVAHMNFQLRGEESEADERFVKAECENYKIEFFCKTVNTKAEKESGNESTQMVARRLRYAWLNELKNHHSFSRILTAHHARDQAETILLNLMRGTGPQGLQGMNPDTGILLRPLLRVGYERIDTYSKEIKFREDKSNAETKYKRNFLRHKVLAPWEENFPGTVHQITRSSEILLETNRFLNKQLDNESKRFISETRKEFCIDYSLAEHEDARLLMRHILEPYGLKDQTAFILQERTRPGAIFSSEKYILLADRKHWIITRKEEELKPIYLAVGMEVRWGDYELVLKDRLPGDSLSLNESSILLSKDHLRAPLVVRAWEEGDKMQPFGMKGMKNLSDIFVDAKIKRTKKDRVPVLCNEAGEILWLVGVRSSELLRLTNPGQAPYILEMKDYG